MKIGILTLPLYNNYGGILQAFALQMVLECIGHDVYVIDVTNKYSRVEMFLRIVKRLIKKYFLGKINTVIFYERERRKENEITSQHTSQFINSYIHKRIYRKYSDIRESDFDAIVVGSDQVWRPEYFVGSITHAFLDFTKGWKNVKRISYAASFGTDEWSYSKRQEKKCGQLIKNFDAVSVRELIGADLCKDHWGIHAISVLDPTLLLSKEIYEQIVLDAKTPKSPGNLLCYVLDENEDKQKIIKDISEQHNLVPFRVNSRYEDHSAPLSERIQPPVESWLRGFMDAKFVITDSFHACVFSILFNKPFVVIGNIGRGMARFNTLITIFDLQQSRVSSDVIIQMDNNWEVTNQKLDFLRTHSIDFIESNLKAK